MAIQSHRRVVFEELLRLVEEYDDCERANDRWNLDDALSNLIIKLNVETRYARKLQAPAKAKAATENTFAVVRINAETLCYVS